eukprot:g16499.t1
MQILNVSADDYAGNRNYLNQMHRLRAAVFGTRLEWDVTITEQGERDQYDDLRPTCILAISADQKVVGCARLLPASGPTMLEQTFPQLLERGSLDAHAAVVESSRFCVDTSLAAGRGGSLHQVTLTMFAGIIEWIPLGNRAQRFRPLQERRVTQLRSHPRLVRKLQDALGDQLCVALDDATVVEIMLNPDGKLFIERLGHGVAPAGAMSAATAEIVIGSVAHALQSEADDERPIISGELPIGGHRFEGLLPPVVSAPAFTIRRRASRLIPLDDYVTSKVMTEAQASVLRSAIASRMNIMISGGTGSGKTTLANAVIAEIVATAPDDRMVILEDTAEIQCSAENAVSLHTTDTVDMARLLKSTMRLRPDRMIVGEVRDGAALTLLKAWNTGHPGGVTTIHSNTAMSALRRLEQLTAEASQQPMQEVIGEAVDLVVSIERTGKGRRVRDVILVEGFSNARYRTEHYAEIDEDSHAA